MNITLLALNARYTHSSLSIRYLREYAKTKGYNCNLLELTINTNILEILNEIYKLKPDCLGFSVYIWNSKLVKEILLEIKKILPNVVIMLGGPEVSYNPKKWLDEFNQVNYIITKNPEDAFVKALSLPKQKIVEGEKVNFEDLPFAWIDKDFPENKNKYLYYESSRGCPFKCSYCLSSRQDIKLEFRKWEDIKNELDFFIKHDVKIVKFVDRTFNFKKSQYKKIWEYLIFKSPKTKFHFEIHPALLDDDDFTILKKAKPELFQFEVGIQSLNQNTLKAINRFCNYDIVFNNIKKLINLGSIHIHTDLIAGLPFEDLKSFEKSFNGVYKLNAEQLQLGFLKVLQGTTMQINKDEYKLKYLSNSPYEVLSTKWLDYSHLNVLKQIENCVDILHNSGNFKNTIKLLTQNNAFNFYKEFALNYFEESHDFAKNSKNLLNYAKNTNNLDVLQVIDALRFDWCFIAKSRNYPEYIKIKDDEEISTQMQEIKLNLKQEGVINKIVTVKQLRHSILYKPITNYGKKLIRNNKAFLFYNEPKNKKIIEINFI